MMRPAARTRAGTRLAAVLLAAALTSGAATADANPIDLLGFGARLPAIGNAGVATGDVSSAPFSNAAACAPSEHLRLSLGYLYASIGMDRNGRAQDLPDAHGIESSICLPVPVPLRQVRLAVGVGLHMPDQWIARIALQPASQPHFVRWDNQPHRIAFNPTVSLQLGRMLSIGAGATMLADGAGNGIAFRVGIKSGQVIAESALDVELPIRAAPVLGVLFSPREDLRFGARYSGELSLDLRLDTLAQVNVPGTPIGGDTLISVRGIDLYTPEQVAAGLSAGPFAGWTASTELVWARWSALDQVVSDVALLVKIGITPSILQSIVPAPGYHDTLSPRLGIEKDIPWGPHARVTLRGGYRFEPSPVPDQTGLTSFADADRHVFGLGAGLRVAELGAERTSAWTLDASFAWDHLIPRETHKDDPASPGGDFVASGEVFAVSAMTGVEF